MTEKRHLITCILFLLLLVIALITMMVLQRFQGKTPIVIQAEPLAPPAPTFSKVPPTKHQTTVTQKTRNVCETPECIQLAYQLHNYQDPSVDPCKDFYKFSCGKFNEHNIANIAVISSKVPILSLLINEFLHKKEPTTSISENAMHLLYQKCQEFHHSERRSLLINAQWKEVVQMMQSFGGWPILDRNWDESKFDLNDMLIKFAEYGFTKLGLIYMKYNQKDLYVGFVSPYENSSESQLETNIVNILQSSGIQPDQALISEDIKQFFEFLNNIREGFLPEENFQFGDFDAHQQQVPSLDYKRILKTFIRSENKEEAWDKIKSHLVTVVEKLPEGQITGNFEKVLTTTLKRTIANFIMFHALAQIIEENNKNDCEKLVQEKLPLAALRVFVRNHFNKENLKMGSEMADNMIISFIDIIQKSTWLHENTKKSAIEKVEMIEKLVGYPDEMEEPGALDKTFESLKLSPDDSFFTTSSKIMKLQMDQTFDYLTGSLRISDYKVLTGNAVYYKHRNGLIVFIPLLDVYDSSYPKYAMIAGVGNVIGHEIGHGFDPEGRKANGTGQDEDWWSSQDSVEYEKRAQCLVDQYNSYDDPHFGRKLNGTTTLAEMAADNIGTNMAWNSYKNSDMSKEPSIVGFENYNLDKLFFRISALNWCSGRPTDTLEAQLKEVHPTHSFRVNGAFSNMKSFAEAFNCPVGSPMNPEKKCELF